MLQAVPLIPLVSEADAVFQLQQLSDNTELPTWIFSEIIANLSTVKDEGPYEIVAKGNDLATLLHTYPQLKQDIVLRSFLNKMSYMLWNEVSEVRAVGYRLIRLLIASYENLYALIQGKVLILIITTLSTLKLSLVEKDQAIKLIRQFLKVPNGADYLSVGVIKLLIALIELRDDEDSPSTAGAIPDDLRELCLQAICEICLLKPELVFLLGGFRVLLQAVLDLAQLAVAIKCLVLVTETLDTKQNRKYLRNGWDLNLLFAPFHDTPDNEADGRKLLTVNTVKIQRASFVISLLFKLFNGLVALLIDGFVMVKDWLNVLKKRNRNVRQYVMEVISDVLGIAPLSWLVADPEMVTHAPVTSDLRVADHFRGLLLSIFIKLELLDRLGEIIDEDACDDNVLAAKKLLNECYQLVLHWVPVEYMSRFQWPSQLFPSSFSKQININILPLRNQLQSMVNESKYHVDDNEFRMMMANSKVITMKEYTEWNWSTILKLLDGPLENPLRFEEVLEKYPKFFKRLMLFYRPFKFRYCNMDRHSKNAKRYTMVGCLLFKLLITLDKGRKYLAKNKILAQIAEALAQIDPMSGIYAKDPILSRKRLETTVLNGYLKFIGTLLMNHFGLRLLANWQIFDTIHHLVINLMTSDTNNYLLHLLLNLVDYSVEYSPFRVILHRVLSTLNSKLVHIFMDDLVPRLIQGHGEHQWLVRMLLELIFNPDDEGIRHLAAKLLSAYLDLQEHVATVVQQRPLIHLLERYTEGRSLLFKMMTIPSGFKYLESAGFIDKEFEKWTADDPDFKFMYKMEEVIHNQLVPMHAKHDTFVGRITAAEPPLGSRQLFSNLLATEEGLHYCQQRLSFFSLVMAPVVSFYAQLFQGNSELALQIGNATVPESMTALTQIKQLLWIIGHVALGKYGIRLLDGLGGNIVQIVHNLFTHSPIWQIRALLFYVLGMMCTTNDGMEILDEMGWVTAVDAFGQLKGMCYPQTFDLQNLFNITVTNPYRDVNYYSIFNGSGGGTTVDFKLFNDDEDEVLPVDANNDRVINLVHGLDLVLGKVERRAQKELIMMKQTHPELFVANAALFLEVIKAVDKGSYNYAKRDFIMSLFLTENKIIETVMRKR